MLRIRNEPSAGVFIGAMYYYIVDFDLDGLADVGSTTRIEALDRQPTVFERSHIPLNKWLMASFLICASKKGMSAHQLHRMLGVSYKSTWFMMHRIREAMRDGSFPTGPMGGENK